MSYTFECKACGACGCGVSLYDEKGNHVSKVQFQKHPETLYCLSHVPVRSNKPKTEVKTT